MARKKKLTRKDYEKMIFSGTSAPGKRGRVSKRQKGGIMVDDLVLAKMIGQNNRNARQRRAIAETMNNSQIRKLGYIIRDFLNSNYKLTGDQIKKLTRNKKFISALINPKVPSHLKKEIYVQKGGFLGALLPIAAKVLGPVLLGPLAKKLLG